MPLHCSLHLATHLLSQLKVQQKGSSAQTQASQSQPAQPGPGRAVHPREKQLPKRQIWELDEQFWQVLPLTPQVLSPVPAWQTLPVMQPEQQAPLAQRPPGQVLRSGSGDQVVVAFEGSQS